ncbi:unnamed protein product [Parajaminaea phylloscopi]
MCFYGMKTLTDGWDVIATFPITVAGLYQDGTWSYRCEGLIGRPGGEYVGDWSRLRPGYLEFSKACHDGYATWYDGPAWQNMKRCWKSIGVCPQFTEAGVKDGCYGMAGHDDCEWPSAVKDPPLALHVYVKDECLDDVA